ncbi:MAG TPA: hypothetical protein VKV77_11145 [Methylovirgula sp.]|nr:hypothetical protein [Methylovirgula sp.]
MSRKARQLRLPFDGKRFARTAEQMEMLELLKKRYGAGDWAALAYALAMEYVPAFSVIHDLRCGKKGPRK